MNCVGIVLSALFWAQVQLSLSVDLVLFGKTRL
jgi:hypothetical protein